MEAYQHDMRASGDVVENAALLIASAPELLEALQEVLEAGWHNSEKPPVHERTGESHNRAVEYMTRRKAAHIKGRQLVRKLLD